MYRTLKPLLFLLPAETSHVLVMSAFRVAMASPRLRDLVTGRLGAGTATSPPDHAGALRQELLGVTFENPVGLAAGFDKNGTHHRELSQIGFGFVEIGTVTALAQSGNPRPRLFRLARDRALINRMGFNNDGAAAVAARLARRKPICPLGINIGRSKVTANADAIDDYGQSLELLWPYASYIAVNVSSPNTPELRALQGAEYLERLLRALRVRLEEAAEAVDETAPPILVKIAPDLDEDQVSEIAEVVGAVGISGVIATNTTISRQELSTPEAAVSALGAGGLSGAPLRERSLEMIRLLRRRLEPDRVIIGVGGVSHPDDAWRLICAGANLIQVYTGLIYEGPGLPAQLNRGLWKHLEASGYDSIGDAVGSDGAAAVASR